MKVRVIFLLFLLPAFGFAQEFFPNLESANNVPKGALVAGLSNEMYNDESQFRLWQGYSITYGINSKLSIAQTYSFSNHHGYFLPNDFVQSQPSGALYTYGYEKGQAYPFSFENFMTELKWRFLNIDGQKKNFRMALYVQASGGNEPHTTAEPNLLGDNSGLASGLAITLLRNRIAASLNAGYIAPYHYLGQSDTITIKYGTGISYSLSLGYLLCPVTYKDYNQLGINLYVELVGESYSGAKVIRNGRNVCTTDAPSLNAGYYDEIRPAIQFVLNSNTRLDISAAYLLEGNSYERTYPVFYLSITHNFYP